MVNTITENHFINNKDVFQQEFMLEGSVNKYGRIFRFFFSNFEITIPVRTRKASKPYYHSD